jgi:lysozyme
LRWAHGIFIALAVMWVAVAVAMVFINFSRPADGKTRDHGMTRRISAAGLEHIKHFEGLRLKSYYCVAGRCTIGFGHAGGDVKPGMTITLARAEELLRQDLDTAERAVAELVKVPLRQGQFDACVDFVFNLGRQAFAGSTLLKLLNKREHSAAAEELMRWVHSGGRVVAGLQRRRLAARDMWNEHT